MNDNPEQSTARPALVDRLGDGLTRLCLTVAGAALIAIVAINGTNVVARYAFGSPFSWAEELMLFLMILSVFSGAVAITWRNMHIRIDTFIELVSPQMRQAALTIGALVSIAVLLIVSYASANIISVLRQIDQRSDALDVPAWIPQSFLTIGLVIIAMAIGVRTLQTLIRTDRRSAAPRGDDR